MPSKNTMITFYKACGYGPNESRIRAGRYIELQTQFNEANKELSEMTDEDGRKLEETKNGK